MNTAAISSKQRIIKLLRAAGSVAVIVAFNRLLRRISSLSHYLQFVLQWGVRPVPGWFDHYLDIHYLWGKTRIPLSCERGILGLLAIKQGASLLELCCGDGFNTFHFYSIRAGKIVAMDLDENAIASAQRTHSTANIEYVNGDIRRDMPNGQFDNVVWDASLEYFTPDEISQLMAGVKQRLSSAGILSGQVLLLDTQAEEHSHVFRTADELAQFLRPHFRNIQLVETRYPSRHNVYFYASDAVLPFPPAE
jgi:ubiquinone/menaquinone biosynthesis C-methylase UbiE